MNVLDVDDNDPIFRSSHYTTTISESTPIGITVISTVDAFDFDSVRICVAILGDLSYT